MVRNIFSCDCLYLLLGSAFLYSSKRSCSVPYSWRNLDSIQSLNYLTGCHQGILIGPYMLHFWSKRMRFLWFGWRCPTCGQLKCLGIFKCNICCWVKRTVSWELSAGYTLEFLCFLWTVIGDVFTLETQFAISPVESYCRFFQERRPMHVGIIIISRLLSCVFRSRLEFTTAVLFSDSHAGILLQTFLWFETGLWYAFSDSAVLSIWASAYACVQSANCAKYSTALPSTRLEVLFSICLVWWEHCFIFLSVSKSVCIAWARPALA